MADASLTPSPLPVVPSTSACSSPRDSLSLSNILSGSPLSKPGGFLPHGLVPGFGAGGPMNALPGVPGPLPPNLFSPLGNMLPGEQIPREHSPQPGGAHSQGKRANRTRFTDYQIKVLQEFFENNAYPKDDDLEYLSKLLNLSPRVIVVWFQNARQKARKIYENQPPLDPNDDGAGRFTRTPGLNYQCKKCLLVFQRYYELIRHQKQHCFKEEDAKRSAQAQKAAAQAAAQFSTQAISNMNPLTPHSEDSNSSLNHDKGRASPPLNSSGGGTENNRRDSADATEAAAAAAAAAATAFDQGMFHALRLSAAAAPPPPPPPPPGMEEEIKKLTPSKFDQVSLL